MKKYLELPFFVPIISILLSSLFVNIIFIFFPYLIPEVTNNFNLIDILTYTGYISMIFSFFYFYKDFNNKIDYSIYIFLCIAAFLREAGIQHWLTSTDSTVFKIRFFTNSNNYLHEKIIAALLIVLILYVLIYLAKKFGIYLIKSFLKMNPTSWSIGTFFGFLAIGKFIDRFPSNYNKYYGYSLNMDIKNNLEVLEETLELFLPLIVILILIQYHFGKEKTNKHQI